MDTLIKKYEMLLKALKSLEEVIHIYNNTLPSNTEYVLRRDALIKRFEYCSDILWKYLKNYLAERGIAPEQITPKSIYRECTGAKIITEEEGRILNSMVETRNQTVHTYDEEFAEIISHQIPKYYVCMQEVSKKTQP